MTQRLIFHGSNSEDPLVILEGRAPAQATGDGTRLVRVRQAAISTEGNHKRRVEHDISNLYLN